MRFLLVGLLSACFLAAAPGRPVTDSEVRQVHESALLIDTHNDITGRTVNGFDISESSGRTHTDLGRLRAGGVGAVFFAVYVAAEYANDHRSAHRALEMIDTIRHDIAGRYSKDFDLAFSAEDIVRARKQGRIAALLGIEGGHAIEDSPRLLRQFYNLGVRYMTLTHANTHNWADSSGDQPRHNGLTSFGRDVVREMNRLGMLVDISHVSDKTFWDALEASRAPVFASHSSCRALSKVARNMTDEMIAATARKGGVVQVNFGCNFLSQESADVMRSGAAAALRAKHADSDQRRAALEKLLEQHGARATLADAVAHIDHIVKIAGVDAAGIGSDFDGVPCVPIGLEDVSKFPNLTRALLEKGYSAADIHKIYGGNLLRVLRAVEKTASGSAP